jgi:DNA-directed RNA polymerase subunit RPC12/RpoP
VSSNLQRRVESLEDGAPGRCRECGHDPDATIHYVICWESDPDGPVESSPPCPRCGHRDAVRVDWEDHAIIPDYPPWTDNEGGG